MADRYVKSDENKNFFYLDATNLCDHSMSQVLAYDEIEKCHGHPDIYMNKLEDLIITPDDSDISYLVEVNLK